MVTFQVSPFNTKSVPAMFGVQRTIRCPEIVPPLNDEETAHRSTLIEPELASVWLLRPMLAPPVIEESKVFATLVNPVYETVPNKSSPLVAFPFVFGQVPVGVGVGVGVGAGVGVGVGVGVGSLPPPPPPQATRKKDIAAAAADSSRFMLPPLLMAGLPTQPRGKHISPS